MVCQHPLPLLPSHYPRDLAVGQAPRVGVSRPWAQLGQDAQHRGRASPQDPLQAWKV